MGIEKEYQKEIGELVKLIGRRWDILSKLSEMEKSYMTELSRKLGKSIQQIYYELKELEEKGLVKSEQNVKERRKYYHVSEYAKMILEAVNQVIEFRPEEKLEEWKINELLDILEDQNLSENLRLSYSESFHGLCSNYPMEVIRNPKVRNLFEEVVKDPLFNNVRKDLMRSVSAVLPHASRHKDWGKWVLENLYPIFVENIEKQNGEVRLWAIKKLGAIAANSIEPSVKGKVENKFLEIWFSSDTDAESDLGKEVFEQLVGLFSRSLFESVRARVKKEKDKVKAEMLLERLKECLMSK